jgi:hypothetical protein
MNREKLSKFYKYTVIFIGAVFLILAVFNLPMEIFSWSFFFLIVFTLLVTPRMTLRLPRAKFILSFSDSIIFLAFILYGGYAAILLAGLETLANCLYIKKSGVKFSKLMIFFNVSSAALSTTVTYIFWLLFTGFTAVSHTTGATSDLILTLGVLAVSQFLSTSLAVSFLHSITSGESAWRIWKRDCFASSLTQIGGATLAGVAYKLIASADYLNTAIALFIFSIIYLNYRQT